MKFILQLVVLAWAIVLMALLGIHAALDHVVYNDAFWLVPITSLIFIVLIDVFAIMWRD